MKSIYDRLRLKGKVMPVSCGDAYKRFVMNTVKKMFNYEPLKFVTDFDSNTPKPIMYYLDFNKGVR